MNMKECFAPSLHIVCYKRNILVDFIKCQTQKWESENYDFAIKTTFPVISNELYNWLLNIYIV